ncbi:MAG: hypothetical protein V4722_00370 [Bacteroidota bacterium]
MNNPEHIYLQQYIQLVEQKLGWQPLEEWRNYEFNELSEKILDTTSVNLSATTLKRVFGKVKYDSLPSSATLNALAAFLGYSNWMAFKSEKKPGPVAEEEHMISLPAKKRQDLFYKVLLAGAAVLTLVFILGFIILSGKPAIPLSKTDSIVFGSRRVAAGLPNTVVFNLDLKGIQSDNMRIQQDWDSARTIQIQPGQTAATGFYYRPGYFRAKLIIDEKVVKEHDLFIKAEEWMATIDLDPVPDYLKKEELVLNNEMGISNAILQKIKGITTPVALTYHLVRPFNGLQSDQFTFRASLKNIFGEGPAVCKTTKIYILCTRGFFAIPLSIPGCVGDINMRLSDKRIEGRVNDLSLFGTDLSVWNKIKVAVENRRVTISLNEKVIYKDQYQQDAGEVVGLRFSFAGAGSVDDVSLSNNRNEIVYKSNF